MNENEKNFLLQVCQTVFENLFQKGCILSRKLFTLGSVTALDERKALSSYG